MRSAANLGWLLGQGSSGWMPLRGCSRAAGGASRTSAGYCPRGLVVSCAIIDGGFFVHRVRVQFAPQLTACALLANGTPNGSRVRIAAPRQFLVLTFPRGVLPLIGLRRVVHSLGNDLGLLPFFKGCVELSADILGHRKRNNRSADEQHN